MTPALTLEQQLAQIAADNGLTSVNVGRMPVGERIVWTADVHWDGFSRRRIPCISGHSDSSIQEAIAAALEKAAEDRVPLSADVPALVPMQVAA